MVKAVLLDPEARNAPSDPTYGKLKEPALYMLNVLRAFNAMSANGAVPSDGYLNTAATARDMGQEVFRPTTVFSYFPQDYYAPPASAGLLGPEFGIMDATTVAEARELRQPIDLQQRHRGQLRRELVQRAQRDLDQPDRSCSCSRRTRRTSSTGSTA